MIIVYNALSLRPGVDDGAATFTLNVVRHLPALLPEHEFVVLVRPRETRVPCARNLRVLHVPLVRNVGARIGAEMIWLSTELRRLRAAILVSPNESIPLRPPCPVVVVAQNLVYHRDEAWNFHGIGLRNRFVSRLQAVYYRQRMRRVFERATAVVAVSKTTAQLLAQRAGLDRAKTRVVYEGADSFLLPDRQAERLPEPRLLVVSTLAPYKNLGATIELFACVKEMRSELVLEIVGADWRGFGQVLDEMVRARGLTASVRFRGPVAAQDLARLYATSLLLLNLSECESFGLPAVEAMRFGLPVVIGDQASLQEVCAGAALVVDPRRLAGAAKRISAILEDGAARRQLADWGYKRAGELTWQRSAEGIAEVLISLAGRSYTGLAQ
jgi:glycosyltransferase involved in cell wall biosynthesis